jgi:hypothetical protein
VSRATDPMSTATNIEDGVLNGDDDGETVKR